MVTARFKVSRVTHFGIDPQEFLEALERGDSVAAEIEMTPDYAQGKNKDWATATPSGVFRLTVQNPAAIKQLMGEGYLGAGKSVEIDIKVVDD